MNNQYVVSGNDEIGYIVEKPSTGYVLDTLFETRRAAALVCARLNAPISNSAEPVVHIIEEEV